MLGRQTHPWVANSRETAAIMTRFASRWRSSSALRRSAHVSIRTITVTGPGASITGATVTTDPTGHGDRTGHGAPIDHGAPTGPIIRTDRIGPTDPTGQTDRIVQTDQIVRTDQIAPIGRIGLIAADQQSIARRCPTYNPAAPTALAARRRRRRLTVSSRTGRAAILDREQGICGLYI